MTSPLTAAGLVLAALLGCASTTVTDVWRDDAYTGGPLQRVLVVGVARREANERIFETELVAALAGHGVEAVPAHRLLPAGRKDVHDRLQAIAVENGMQGVLVATLLGVDRETRVVGGTTRVIPRAHRRMGGYHGSSYALVHTPRRKQTVRVARVESNLYTVSDDTLIWSGTSETFDAQSAASGIRDFSGVLAAALAEAGLVGSVR